MDIHLLRSREEARLRALPIPWAPPGASPRQASPASLLPASLVPASLVAGQVRRQLWPCCQALRAVGLEGCAHQLLRLDHVLERIASFSDEPAVT